MTLREIMAGVETSVKGAFADWPVYWNRKPKGFVRPSFLLEGGPLVSAEMGGGQEQNTAQVRLTCFTPVDAYGNSQSDDLLDAMEAMRALFRGGHIKIGDRCPHVTEVSADYGLDYAEVTARLEFFEPSMGRPSKPATGPLMERFSVAKTNQ